MLRSPRAERTGPSFAALQVLAASSLLFGAACGGSGSGAADGSVTSSDASASDDGAQSADAAADGGSSPGGLLPPSRSPVLSYCPFDDAVDLSKFEGRPVVRVCHPGDSRSGCDVTTIAAAIANAQNGDRIEIVNDGTPYTECAVIPDTLSDVEIIGVCGTPHIKDVVCQRKGIFLNLGTRITLTNLEVSNASISGADGGNAAAVRDQSQGDLSLRYVYFHHNQNGVLGGKGVVTIDWSKFEANGSPVKVGFAHNIYMSADVTDLSIRNSQFLRASNQGNNLKTRAQKFSFHCSVSASLDGEDSRELDISEGGEVSITNSLIEQGPSSVNTGMLGFAPEAGNPDRRHAIMTLSIQDTDFINDLDRGSFLSYNAYNGFTLDLSNVRFIGPGATLTNVNGGADTVTQAGVQSLANRSAAGLSAYSSDATQLPPPPGCPDFEYF